MSTDSPRDVLPSGRRLSGRGRIAWRFLRRNRFRLTVVGEDVAEISREWVASSFNDATKMAVTSVRFPDGSSWTIEAQPPDTPPPHRTTGLLRRKQTPGLHPLASRIITVRDGQQRVLAVARFETPDAPEAGHETNWQEARDAVTSGLSSLRQELTTRREHRRGKAKHLVAALFSAWLAVGSIPVVIYGLATGSFGFAIAFAVVAAVFSWFGIRSWRIWRDPEICWSCGKPITGEPDACPFCDAADPAGAGLGRRFLGSPVRIVGVKMGAGVADRLGFVSSEPTPVVAAGTSSDWLLAGEGEQRFETLHRWGHLKLAQRFGSATLMAENPVPLEAAVLCWHVSRGDYRVPSTD